MKKIILSVIFGLFIGGICTSQEMNVGILNGPSGVPVAYLMQNTNKIRNIDVKYKQFASAQALLPKLLKGEIDVGFLPPNVAAKVYNSANQSIICCAIVGNGNISLLTKDKSIKSIADLKGKTVYVAGQGATPEYMFRYLLEKNGVEADTPDGVTLDFSVPNAQLPAQLIAGKIDYIVVPEPFSTIALTKSKDVITAIDFQKEYAKFNGAKATYPITVMVARKEFALQNKSLIVSFLQQYEKGLKWTVQNPKLSGLLCEKMNLGLAADIIANAIPKSNYVYIKSSSAKPYIDDLLNIFLKNDPQSIGGILPDEGFYF